MTLGDPVTLVGRGAVGTALAAALRAHGPERDVRAIGRGSTPAERAAALDGARLVVLCVPDRAVGEAADALAEELASRPDRPAVVHTAGSLDAAPLARLAGLGCPVGALHPALALPRGSAPGGDAFVGAAFVFTGEEGALGAAQDLARTVGGELLAQGPADRARYHGACALLSNGLSALFATASDELAGSGLAPDGVRHAALSLLGSTTLAIGGAARREDALTGPVVRGDVETVGAHLAALRGEARALYRQLSLRLVDLAVSGERLDAATAARLRELLEHEGPEV